MTEQTKSPIEIIITTDDPQALVKQAKQLAARLKGDEATKTQIRRLFSTLRQIEMSWPRESSTPPSEETKLEMDKQRDDAYRELVLFGPRLSYQTEKHRSLAPLATAIQEGIKHVGKDRNRLKRLVQFFEATVAYYIAGPTVGD